VEGKWDNVRSLFSFVQKGIECAHMICKWDKGQSNL